MLRSLLRWLKSKHADSDRYSLGNVTQRISRQVRHSIPSMILSLDDEPFQPSERLIKLALAGIESAFAVNLEPLVERCSGDAARWVATYPGEHYRLLAGFIRTIRPERVIEIGTATGASCLAMKAFLPAGSKLVTYDIVPWQEYPEVILRSEDFDPRLEQRVVDLTDPGVQNKEKDRFEQADFIFIDAAKDGMMEQVFCNFLDSCCFQKPPIVLFDDIRFLNMIEVWRSIRHPKMDLTSFGHWSGTGLVEWK